jgi:hypothetical protein
MSVGQIFLPGYGYGDSARSITLGGASVARTWYGYSHYTMSIDGGNVIDATTGYFNHSANHVVYPWSGGKGSDFPSGEAKYMAVRFSDIDGYHYGWISVARNGWDFDAFAWGYETEPGVPIIAGIPAPGTLAALAFGAVVTRRGRKRKDD